MALAIGAFACLTLLAFGATPLFVTLHAIHKTLVFVVPTVPICFHTSGCGTLA